MKGMVVVISVKKRVVSGVFALAIMASSMGVAGGTAIDNSPINVSVSASADTIKSTGTVTVANPTSVTWNAKSKVLSWSKVNGADLYVVKGRYSVNNKFGEWRLLDTTTKNQSTQKIPTLAIPKGQKLQITVQAVKGTTSGTKKVPVYSDINKSPKVEFCSLSSVEKSTRFGTCGAALAALMNGEKNGNFKTEAVLRSLYADGCHYNVTNNTYRKAKSGNENKAGCTITQLSKSAKKIYKLNFCVNKLSNYSTTQIKSAIDSKLDANHRVIVGYRSSTSASSEQRYLVVFGKDSSNYHIYNPINGSISTLSKTNLVNKINAASAEFKGIVYIG